MTDAIRLYLRDIRRIPLLSAEEERKLSRMVRKGDSKAKRKLIQSNLRLVINIAKRYSHLGMSLADLIEEGNLGLIKAVEKYNPRKGYRFSTYAGWWIRQFITRAIANQSHTVRLPVYITEMISKWRHKTELLTQRLGRKPSTKEVADYMGLPLYKVKKAQQLASKTMTSLDIPIGEEGSGNIIDIVEYPSDTFGKNDITNLIQREDVEKLLSRMNDRERDILVLRYGLKDGVAKTLGQIAKLFGITRERIRQIESAALNKLRQYARV